jgi:tetratricopeptide (TPR) repeat protein
MNRMKRLNCSLIVVLVLSGCHEDEKAPQPAASAAPSTAAQPVPPATPAPLRGKPRTQAELATTSAEIYLGNLDGQVDAMDKIVKRDPKSTAKLGMLSGAHYVRGKHRGDLDEIQQAIDITSSAIKLEPGSAPIYIARADQEQSLHRFPEARADIEKAKTLGATGEDVAAVVQELDWNDGKYDAAIAAIRAASTRKSLYTLAREAQLHHDLGEQDAADREFEEAEDLLRDTSPIPLAWINVQRGLHKMKTGKFEDAILFYREAVARIPSFVMANEHLAEALHLVGKDDEAIAIYEDVTKRSPDPEFMGALAALYREKGKAKEADALKAKATARYGELLAKYPQAMYWHASEFFMSEGANPKKALELLTKNLALRPNSVSYVALARAQLANKDPKSAQASIDKALAMPIKSAELYWTAARVYASVGDPAKASDFSAKAKAFNPLIEKTEPKLDAK